jgi:hypothetical protein
VGRDNARESATSPGDALSCTRPPKSSSAWLVLTSPASEQFTGQILRIVVGQPILAAAALDQRIAKTKANKGPLLMVLRRPEIPLHNNPKSWESTSFTT